MEEIKKYLNCRIVGFSNCNPRSLLDKNDTGKSNDEHIDIFDTSKKFDKLASDLYDILIKNPLPIHDNTTTSVKYNLTNKNFKEKIIKSTNIFIKYYLNIVNTYLHPENTVAASHFGRYEQNRNYAMYIKKICSYSDDLLIAISPELYIHNNNDGKTLRINETHGDLLSHLLDIKANKDIFNVKYSKKDSIYEVSAIFKKLIEQQESSELKYCLLLEFYLLNQYFLYPIIDIVKANKKIFDDENRMNTFILDFLMFGFTEPYLKYFETISELIYKRRVYLKCIDAMGKFYLNQGFVFIGCATEKHFLTVSTLKDYINTLTGYENKAAQDIIYCTNISEIEYHLKKLNDKIEKMFDEIGGIRSLSKKLCLYTLHTVIDNITEISNPESKRQYIKDFYSSVSLPNVSSVDKFINKTITLMDKNTRRNQSLIKTYRKYITESIEYFNALYKYIKPLHHQSLMYKSLKSLAIEKGVEEKDDKEKENKRKQIKKKVIHLFNVLITLKTNPLFASFEKAILELNSHCKKTKGVTIQEYDDELLFKYYPYVYSFFGVCHETIFITLFGIVLAAKDMKDAGVDNAIIDNYKNIIETHQDISISEMAHFFCSFRRGYKFDFYIPDQTYEDIANYIKKIKRNFFEGNIF